MNARIARKLASALVAAAMVSFLGAGAAPAKELLVYDWNKPVTKAERGFPRDFPPRENGNWVSPVNYAAGRYYYRVQIRKQPTAQQMQLQFCTWQDPKPLAEMCGSMAKLVGRPGTVVTWSDSVASTKLSRKRAIDFRKPRRTNGVAIKDERGYPISDYGSPSWSWFGENPDRWYPLDMRFTVVVVANGSTFSGWGKYAR
jgi:hypothetical protein